MKTNYKSPQVEIIKIEIENALLATSGTIEGLNEGSTFGDF